MIAPRIQITQYRVSLLPDSDHPDEDSYAVAVENRGHARWAVLNRGRWCISKNGTWDLEPIPSERDEQWLAGHRFDLGDALTLAFECAPHVKVNGVTAAEWAAGQARAGVQS